jgi:uracil-DNA glycosylase family 4
VSRLPPGLAGLNEEILQCRRCPRLVAWREKVGRVKRRAYAAQTYWSRPVTGFGDPKAGLVIVGLAPGAHGANRTGRVFTGDRSGDFLYAGLFRAGWASQPISISRTDGLGLSKVWITLPVRCVPPDNLPNPRELARCAPFLERELSYLPARVFLALGALAWKATLGAWENAGLVLPRPRPAFAHGAVWTAPDGRRLLGCYHVSQQNTQTGRLTPVMFDRVLARAKRLV